MAAQQTTAATTTADKKCGCTCQKRRLFSRHGLIKLFFAFVAATIAGEAVGFGEHVAMAKFLPQLVKEYLNTALFRPHNDPRMLYVFFHPALIALLVVRRVACCPCPALHAVTRVTVSWALMLAPGLLISWATMPLSPMMVAEWWVSSVLTVFAETVACAMVLRSTACAEEKTTKKKDQKKTQ